MFTEKFNKVNINNHNPRYLTLWKKPDHGQNAYHYNLEWEIFFLKPRTKKEILAEAKVIMKKFKQPIPPTF